MSFFLRQTKMKGDVYLQIYNSIYNKEKKQGRNTSVRSLGMVEDLKKKGIADPIAHYQKVVQEMNEASKKKKEKQIGEVSSKKNVGHFIIRALLNALKIQKTLDTLDRGKKFRVSTFDLLSELIEAQIVCPCSKWVAFETVIPSLYGATPLSYDQILEGINRLGNDYEKYIELFNVGIERTYGRKKDDFFFDCTNYYFEIDLPKGDRQKGPSKEKRTDPIIGQALLMDGECIPLGMSMFPGNESEKPLIRKAVQEFKERYGITSHTVQVADKGLNCARNIYEATKEGSDGYIFSKSIKGKNLSEIERKWILLEDGEANVWTTVKEKDGTIRFKYKEAVDSFRYSFKDDKGKKVEFIQKEKRVVTFNPSLATKQIAEIEKEVEKAQSLVSAKAVAREQYGDSVRFVNIDGVNEDGVITNVVVTMNQEAIDQAKRYAGYNMLVTSEISMSALKIYEVYHQLTRIEECFRIMKTGLRARPVYLQKKESIYGHFLICYLALTVLRLLEMKVFGGEACASKIISFIRNFEVTEEENGEYTNCATMSPVLTLVKKTFQLTKLTNLYLKEKDLDNFVGAELPIPEQVLEKGAKS